MTQLIQQVHWQTSRNHPLDRIGTRNQSIMWLSLDHFAINNVFQAQEVA